MARMIIIHDVNDYGQLVMAPRKLRPSSLKDLAFAIPSMRNASRYNV